MGDLASRDASKSDPVVKASRYRDDARMNTYSDERDEWNDMNSDGDDDGSWDDNHSTIGRKSFPEASLVPDRQYQQRVRGQQHVRRITAEHIHDIHGYNNSESDWKGQSQQRYPKGSNQSLDGVSIIFSIKLLVLIFFRVNHILYYAIVPYKGKTSKASRNSSASRD